MCSWLDILKNKAWKESDHGSLTFAETDMTGWTFDGLLADISPWDCYYNIDYSTYQIVIARLKNRDVI